MSNFNYMDKVPVKIAESFKPPPRLYQLPQAVVHKLQLSVDHYNEAPQYCYDFQLERKVLAKIPEWRRMRQLEREARRERKERREQERLHEVEEKNKQMLGAVSYPSADDLYSSDSDSDGHKKNVLNSANASDGEPRLVLTTQVNSFDNILQPTIISRSNEKYRILNGTTVTDVQPHAKNGKYSGGAKEVNAFNYKDFEEDTSSPFDNVELKTINDLDILAQVLHNTQLHMQKTQIKDDAVNSSYKEQNEENKVDNIIAKLESKDNTQSVSVINENINVDYSKANLKDKMPEVVSLEILQNTKAALQRVDFGNLGHQSWLNENNPNTIITNNSMTSAASFIGDMPNCTSYDSFPNPSNSYGALYNDMSKSHLSKHYTNFNVHPRQVTSPSYGGNHNYLYAPPYNGIDSTHGSPRHLPHTSVATSTYVGNNANDYGMPTLASNGINSQQPQQFFAINDCNEFNSKSKSVPDILKELSDEVRNSEIRRSRYYSFNSEEGKQEQDKPDTDEDITPKQSPVKISKPLHEENCYAKLSPPAQRLATNISSMGFPLERVAKISQIFGTDDKKIVEHLIPLSELMDLGFDEVKISEALIKFDNNKEKALEYLIS
ncbi:uncharacterized protein DDB_G0283357 isoform X2 [Anastrepha ludens]|uniref:uncharacterized protein DDB_G0283357 isoform X2 n=1 Tax=Anastrepha ludens TaxID=28586 RepID=UPI0023AF3B84|nr:uncharacterized protein DDB_G0283357 isoform X2 [Anastrepha ludens]